MDSVMYSITQPLLHDRNTSIISLYLVIAFKCPPAHPTGCRYRRIPWLSALASPAANVCRLTQRGPTVSLRASLCMLGKEGDAVKSRIRNFTSSKDDIA